MNYQNHEDCELLAKWSNNDRIKFFINRFPNEESSQQIIAPEVYQKKADLHSLNRPNRHVFILYDEHPIGFAAYEFDPSFCEMKDQNTVWLSILIGEEEYHGKGISKVVMHDIEQMAIHDGARRFEIGVFEFNTKALTLYKKLGYKEFKRISSFTFFHGRMWDDIRMVKQVSK